MRSATCARLTVQSSQISETYTAKAIAAYARASEIDSNERRPARGALLAFAHWVVDVARALGSYDALKAAALTCERVEQLELLANNAAERSHLREATQRLREQMQRMSSAGTQLSSGTQDPQRQSQELCDQGQMLLRQNQTKEAFELFERALQANSRNHSAWLWRAMALTDMGRFNDALASYDSALQIEPDNARVWNSKGALLTELDRADAALECLNRALELSTSDAKIRAIFWLNKGKALFILKRYQEAREALVRSYQLDPSPESAAGIAACREQIEYNYQLGFGGLVLDTGSIQLPRSRWTSTRGDDTKQLREAHYTHHEVPSLLTRGAEEARVESIRNTAAQDDEHHDVRNPAIVPTSASPVLSNSTIYAIARVFAEDDDIIFINKSYTRMSSRVILP